MTDDVNKTCYDKSAKLLADLNEYESKKKHFRSESEVYSVSNLIGQIALDKYKECVRADTAFNSGVATTNAPKPAPQKSNFPQGASR